MDSLAVTFLHLTSPFLPVLSLLFYFISYF